MMRFFVLAFLCHLAATPAPAADLRFCWLGGGGYSMTGRMKVPDRHMSADIVTEAEVTSFRISGFHEGEYLGSWDMATRRPDTTWHLRFDPAGLRFLTGGSFATLNSQGWNADGDVRNCGVPGFGFNSGNYAQDICVNGQYIEASSIDPTTPLLAETGVGQLRCAPPVLSSKAQEKR